jgi:hypothetical protein
MKSLRLVYTLAVLTLVFQGCSDSDEYPVKISNAATIWADLTLETIKKTPPNSPTFTSRNLGYIGLTMYESVVNGTLENKSLSWQLQDLEALPLSEIAEEYNWTISLNAGQAQILRNLYAHASVDQLEKIDSTEDFIHRYELLTTDPVVAQRSMEFGKAIADAIFEWSKTDGGHEGYKTHFDPAYLFPVGDGYWVPPVDGQVVSLYPLHPYWGENRTFVAANSTLKEPKMLDYSTEENSDYYLQFKAVYDKRISLTAEEMRIAAWWADDPTQTSSPPGHSYNLATLAIRKSKADIFRASEAYAKVGMSVADAFINCWKCKYKYHAERPSPYIWKFIDDKYRRFWPEPPFPAFSSGHATQSAAAAIALESIFGTKFSLTDNTYAGRKPDFEVRIEYRSRTFKTIWETAEECAQSRFLGGIHTMHDNFEGQKQGKLIGRNITNLDWEY